MGIKISAEQMHGVSSLFWRRAKQHTPSDLDLTASYRTIRSNFGYLNPEGLAGVKGLSVSLSIDPDESQEQKRYVMPRQVAMVPQMRYSAQAHLIGSINGVLLKRFPYLNLRGLAMVKGISTQMRVKTPGGIFNYRYTTYLIDHEDSVSGRCIKGIVNMQQNMDSGNVECTDVFPDLPRGNGMGMTLLALILLRGNIYAGKKILLTYVSDDSIKMVKHMEDFEPHIRINADGENMDVQLTIPKLSRSEVSAVELYWERILHLRSE